MCHDCAYLFVGLWLLLSAVVISSYPRGNLVNHLVAGVLLAGLAGWAGFTYGKWLDWAVSAFGAWLVLSAFLFSSNPRLCRISCIVGGLFLIFASFLPFYC
jgi:hypothetical protein